MCVFASGQGSEKQHYKPRPLWQEIPQVHKVCAERMQTKIIRGAARTPSTIMGHKMSRKGWEVGGVNRVRLSFHEINELLKREWGNLDARMTPLVLHRET